MQLAKTEDLFNPLPSVDLVIFCSDLGGERALFSDVAFLTLKCQLRLKKLAFKFQELVENGDKK